MVLFFISVTCPSFCQTLFTSCFVSVASSMPTVFCWRLFSVWHCWCVKCLFWHLGPLAFAPTVYTSYSVSKLNCFWEYSYDCTICTALSMVSISPTLMSFSLILAEFVPKTILSRIISSRLGELQSLANKRRHVTKESSVSSCCALLKNLYFAKLDRVWTWCMIGIFHSVFPAFLEFSTEMSFQVACMSLPFSPVNINRYAAFSSSLFSFSGSAEMSSTCLSKCRLNFFHCSGRLLSDRFMVWEAKFLLNPWFIILNLLNNLYQSHVWFDVSYVQFFWQYVILFDVWSWIIHKCECIN